MIRHVTKALSIGFLSLLPTFFAVPSQALPGQTVEEVAAWIQAHPTLQPVAGERLLVRKVDTAAQRFTFQASVSPPGRVIPTLDRGIIQSERISLFDMVNGVTPTRLAESLRAIYGLDIFQDFQQAQTIYTYPSPVAVSQSVNQRFPLKAALQGEVRSGKRYAYWVEVVPTSSGKSFNGRLYIFSNLDLDKIESELRNR